MRKLPTIAVAQIHSIAGDIAGNSKKLSDAIEYAHSHGASILVTPEMSLSGYPVEDLLGDEAFLSDVEVAAYALAATVPVDMTVLIGAPLRDTVVPHSGGTARRLSEHLDATTRNVWNAVLVARGGEVMAVHAKTLLPTYGVFDDSRWMKPGPVDQELIDVDGVLVGLAVCEDVWTDEVARAAASKGAKILLVPNASPDSVGKPEFREAMLSSLAKNTGMTIAYANSVGGQDEVVYDGGSLIISDGGETLLRAPLFHEGTFVAEGVQPWADENAQVWRALVLGLRNYVRDNGFQSVIVGLSGGIDSAAAAAIAVDALGAENVHGIGMPGPYSSEGSVTDARILAERFGISFDILTIKDTVLAEEAIIGGMITGAPGEKIARENIQARLRALHLMTLANANNWMMLNTGNKSEAAVGYFTLGGDSSGGFAILKDVYKTKVYELCEWRNRIAEESGNIAPIPRDTITKPPSAELAPDQEDTDSLPPYPLLDFILVEYLEKQSSAASTVAKLMDNGWGHLGEEHLANEVLRVHRMVDRAEHKRRQVAPGVKITSRAFGKDRRMPITARRVHHIG